jgi:hypothetical protein
MKYETYQIAQAIQKDITALEKAAAILEAADAKTRQKDIDDEPGHQLIDTDPAPAIEGLNKQISELRSQFEKL